MRAQAALEYLMTYGWALLIVVIVGVALWSLGVFNTNAGNVARLTGIPTIQAIDMKGNSTDFVLVFSPKKSIQSASFSSSDLTNCTISPADTTLSPTKKYTLDCLWANGQKSTFQITLDYTDPISGLSHSETGTVTGV